MQVGIYVRVSTQEQAMEGYSIQAQEEKARMYCQIRGWNVKKVYIDGGYTGSNINRPNLKQMINDIKQHELDLILVYKLDRLSRSQKDTLYLIEDVILKNNVDFVSMQENFDTSTPFGRAIIGILSVFAQLEREQIKERMNLGKEARAKEGLFHGGSNIPIGYDYEDGQLIPNPNESIQIKKIFSLALEGISLRKIQEYMKENYTNRYNSYSGSMRISRILENKIYIGKIKYNDNEYDGKHEPLIDEDTFNKVQLYLKRQRELGSKQPFKKTHLLSGILYCKKCGARMSIQSGMKHKFYVCYSRHKGQANMIKDPNCKNKRWIKEELEEVVINEIRKLSFDNSYLDTLIDKPDSKKEKKSIEKRLTEIDKQINKLSELYSLDGISIEMLKEKLDKLNIEKNTLTDNLFLINNPTKPDKEYIQKQLINVDDILKSDDNQLKINLIHSLIDKIEVDDEDVHIYWSFL